MKRTAIALALGVAACAFVWTLSRADAPLSIEREPTREINESHVEVVPLKGDLARAKENTTPEPVRVPAEVKPNAPQSELYSKEMRAQVRSYLGINLRDYTLLPDRNPQAVKEAIEGYLTEMYSVWWKMNEQMGRLHEAKLESGAVEMVPVGQRLPPGNGAYVRSAVVWDPAQKRDVQKVSRTFPSEDAGLLELHGKMEELKSLLRTVISFNHKASRR